MRDCQPGPMPGRALHPGCRLLPRGAGTLAERGGKPSDGFTTKDYSVLLEGVDALDLTLAIVKVERVDVAALLKPNP